jgi:Putative peptidoglycan binding domain
LLTRIFVVLIVGLFSWPLPDPVASARAQNNFLGIVSKLIEEQRALAERRRQEAIAVKRMQLALKTLGYYTGSVDGDFGSGTQKALQEYRRSIGRSQYQDLSSEEVQEIETRAAEAATDEPEEPEQGGGPPSTQTLLQADVRRRLDMELSSVAAWIVIASRTTAEEALIEAEQYLDRFTSTTVMRSSNGRYAIVAGWLNKDVAKQVTDGLITRGLIPDDSFLSSGEKFELPVWSPNGPLIHSRTDLLNYAPTHPFASERPWTGCSCDRDLPFSCFGASHPNRLFKLKNERLNIGQGGSQTSSGNPVASA